MPRKRIEPTEPDRVQPNPASLSTNGVQGRRGRFLDFLERNWRAAEAKYHEPRWQPNYRWRFSVEQLREMRAIVSPLEESVLRRTYGAANSLMRAADAARLPYELARA